MNIKLLSLVLQCRQSQEVLKFSPQVSFFHGEMSAGKSSIARLIDYCFGARRIEQTTAIRKELVSVELTAQIEGFRVSFERTAEASGSIQVTWSAGDENEFSILAPLQEGENSRSLVGEDVFTFSDLLFYFFGKPPLRVRKSTLDEESQMIRLGFRDILWYCYLDQNKLDNSFFRLDDPVRQTKSRYAIRYVLGYYTERLETLQGQLAKAASDRTGKIIAARQMRDFLQDVGYASEKDIQADVEEVERQLKKATDHQAELEDTFHVDTHFADVLRERLRVLSSVLGQEEQTLADLHLRLDEFHALKSELITARQKLSRSQAASTVLSGVRFESCPQCGTHLPLDPPSKDQDALNCNLCGQAPPKADEARATHLQVAKRDLNNRLQEIEDTLGRSQRSVRKQEQTVETVRRQKNELDRQLQDELRRYDSAFLAQAREVDRRTATLVERLNGLQRFRKIPETIERLEQEAGQLLAEQDRLRRSIREEQDSLISADTLVKELEETYLDVLLTVGVPGVGDGDRVRMNRKSWIPDILEGGEEDQSWNFLSAGSNGKKTLLNVCYALAVHQVAASHDRPLPSLLMIDHPTKCISPDVNRAVIKALYRYIYDLVQGPLKDTQVILIDNDFFAPEGQDIQLFEQYMTPTEDEHPPLISYYRGA